MCFYWYVKHWGRKFHFKPLFALSVFFQYTNNSLVFELSGDKWQIILLKDEIPQHTQMVEFIYIHIQYSLSLKKKIVCFL